MTAELDAETAAKITELIEEDEGATNKLAGAIGQALVWAAVATSLFHLYCAASGSFPFQWAPIVPTYILRPVHVALVMALVFLLFPVAKAYRHRIMWFDWIAAIASLGVVSYIIWNGDEFGERAILPDNLDFAVGIVFLVLLLEATRRSTGWIMPVVSLVFIAYALAGKYLPPPWTHKGYPIERLIGHLYMTLEGIYGTTVDVSSSLIILFTIYGAILQYSGAGKFFIDFSFAAMGGKKNSAGRAVVLSSFLMGGPSGSGVATTVTIGTVAYPLLKRAGYERNAAGGLLAAGGLGAIISPPVLGAAAFLIAEYLKISYLDVIWMAAIPTILYYFAILIMVELDARKYGAVGADNELLVAKGELWRVTKTYWYHFSSLISIIVFMLLGFSPVLSVFWATILGIVVSYLRRDTALTPTKLKQAFAEGTTGVLNVAATCACAGIIVGVVTLTGLAQRFADIIIGYAAGNLVLTAIYTGLIVWVVGLAVPVTASYIMCAVIAAPALIKLGVPDYAAHMFIFYYAVLSEVSPPTALSPFAAAAITGGSPYKTTLQSWKYTMPAFLVPFVFVCDPQGIGLLLKTPKGGNWLDIVSIGLETAIGICFLAFLFQGRFLRKNNVVEASLFALTGLLFVFPSVLTAILKPLTGIDLNTAMFQGLPIGLPLLFGIVLVAYVGRRLMQRTIGLGGAAMLLLVSSILILPGFWQSIATEAARALSLPFAGKMARAATAQSHITLNLVAGFIIGLAAIALQRAMAARDNSEPATSST
jgi:TRAP transporter 4TM/12TM fusion protein